MHPSLLRRVAAAALLAGGCLSHAPRPLPDPAPGLRLQRVVLYRSGVGYFERSGALKGDRVTLRCRKDQLNDLLKSLAVLDLRSGQPVSASLPLDPQRWASAATSLLGPGAGSLGRLLDGLRGGRVELRTASASHSGRVLLVEEDAAAPATAHAALLDGDQVRVVPLAEVRAARVLDWEVAQQLQRSLDAVTGEGMFRQVDVALRLPAAQALRLSYVTSAAVWQPSYRLVLPAEGGEALLQAWAVVANHSGEDWREVQLSLTSAAPAALRYDLHTPREAGRPERLERGGDSAVPAPPAPAIYGPPAPAGPASPGHEAPLAAGPPAPGEHRAAGAAPAGRLRGGQTQHDLAAPVTLPDGAATLVAVL